MTSWDILDYISGMIRSSFSKSLMQIKGSERLLVDEKLPRVFPNTFTFDSLIDDVWRKFDVHVIYKRIYMLID